MLAEIFVRYSHFVAIFIFGMFLVRMHLDRSADLLRLKRLGRYALISLIVIVFSGFGLWFFVGKDAAFYTYNGLFHLKVTLAALLAIFNVIVIFYPNNKGTPYTLRIIHALVNGMLIVFALLPLLAILMASGIGFYGNDTF
jgi:putative membrane protein